MSWFSEIAGKAEDILNKMDQKAAVVLSLTDSKPQSKVKSNVDLDSDSLLCPISSSSGSSKNTVTTSNPGSVLHSRSSSLSSSFSFLSASNSGKKEVKSDDDKLFDFLNSKESLNSSKDSQSSKSDPDLDEKMSKEIKSEAKFDKTPSKVNMVTEIGSQVADQGSAELKKQIDALTKKITALTKKNVDLETEFKRSQKRLDNWQNQLSSSDAALKELQVGFIFWTIHILFH
jgi:hypothetical protein